MFTSYYGIGSPWASSFTWWHARGAPCSTTRSVCGQGRGRCAVRGEGADRGAGERWVGGKESYRRVCSTACGQQACSCELTTAEMNVLTLGNAFVEGLGGISPACHYQVSVFDTELFPSAHLIYSTYYYASPLSYHLPAHNNNHKRK